MTATAEPTPPTTGTVSFGLGQIKNATPEFANWIFRGYFIISKALIGYLAGISTAGVIHVDVKTLLFYSLTISLLLDPIMLGFSKLFGIVPDQIDPQKSFVSNQQIDEVGNTNAIPETVIKAQDSGGKPDIIAP